MKILTKITIAFLFLIFVPVCLAQQPSGTMRDFRLNDGSSFQGILIGVRTDDGNYKIESPKLGTIYVNPDDVISMMTATNPQAPQQNFGQQQSATESTISPGAMKQAQEMLLADPSVNQSIQELMADPEIVQMLQDPEIMQVIMSQDPGAIQANPKVQELLKNPKMQILIQQSGQKLMNQGGNLQP